MALDMWKMDVRYLMMTWTMIPSYLLSPIVRKTELGQREGGMAERRQTRCLLVLVAGLATSEACL